MDFIAYLIKILLVLSELLRCSILNCRIPFTCTREGTSGFMKISSSAANHHLDGKSMFGLFNITLLLKRLQAYHAAPISCLHGRGSRKMVFTGWGTLPSRLYLQRLQTANQYCQKISYGAIACSSLEVHCTRHVSFLLYFWPAHSNILSVTPTYDIKIPAWKWA